jgi:lipopolysaccharide transport system permease protein
MTLLFAFVLMNIFKQPVGETILFIYSGMITWDLIVFTSISGSYCFLNAAPYIKQFPHPLAIYPLRSCLVGIINFTIASVPFMIWSLYLNPSHILPSVVSLPIALILFLLLLWPIGLFCGFLTTIFRDFSQLITIILQALWFISPVFFLPSIFINAGIGFFVTYNPIYYILQLIRDPFLEGVFPSPLVLGMVCGCILCLWLIAWVMIQRIEKRLILYL